MSNRRQWSLSILCSLWIGVMLSGCKTSQLPNDITQVQPKHWLSTMAWRQKQQQWSITGKISVQQPEQSWSGRFRWHHQIPGFKLQILGPLNQEVLSLSLKNQKYTLTTQQTQYQDSDLERLLKRLSHWSLPVHAMQHWLKGIPIPQVLSSLQFNSEQQLARLKQNGWTIEYLRYQSSSPKALPRLMTLKKPPIHCKLIILTWDIGSERDHLN